MAGNIYPNWKKAIMDALANSSIIDDATNGPFVALVDTGVYTYSDTHSIFSSLSGAVVGTPQRITPTATTVPGSAQDAIFSSTGSPVFSTVTGPNVEALVIFRGQTTTASQRLMTYYDTGGGGLPVTPNTGNITITWNAGGIFRLSDAEAKYDIRRIGNIGPLPLYEYRYRFAGSPVCVGLIAQEVEKVIPEAIVYYGGRPHVNYEAAVCPRIH